VELLFKSPDAPLSHESLAEALSIPEFRSPDGDGNFKVM